MYISSLVIADLLADICRKQVWTENERSLWDFLLAYFPAPEDQQLFMAFRNYPVQGPAKNAIERLLSDRSENDLRFSADLERAYLRALEPTSAPALPNYPAASLPDPPPTPSHARPQEPLKKTAKKKINPLGIIKKIISRSRRPLNVFGPEEEPAVALENFDVKMEDADMEEEESDDSDEGGGGGEGSASQEPAIVTCFFRAEMDSPALLNKIVAISFTLSLEELGPVTETMSSSSSAAVKKTRKLTLRCRPVKNFRVEGKDTIKRPVPAPGNPDTIVFNGRCTLEGPCEVAIDVWQDQLPLCTLTLKPECVRTKSSNIPLSAVSKNTTMAPLEEQVNELRITERIQGPDTYYDFELDSPDLKILKRFESQKIDGSRDEYVRNLYKEIEDMWATAGNDPAKFRKEIRRIGVKLFSSLFPEELQEILWNKRDRISSIMVISTEPFIPWELVLIKDPEKKAAADEDKFLCEMGLIRWLYGWRPAEKLAVQNGKAFYIIPEYLDQSRHLAAASLEKEYLEEQFHAAGIPPDPENVEKALGVKGGFDLLHFSCHATVQTDNITSGKLLLQENQVGNTIVPSYLTQLAVEQIDPFADIEGPRPIVFLNACQAGRLGNQLLGFGGFGKAFLDAGAGCFVGALWSIEDNVALTFTKTWYNELIAGRNLAKATILAREAAAKEEGATYLAYVVYGHPFASLEIGL